MSAEILRRAAALMRERFEREDVDDVQEAEFYLASAELLDYIAETAERNARNFPLSDAYQWVPEPALAVARAYLGDNA